MNQEETQLTMQQEIGKLKAEIFTLFAGLNEQIWHTMKGHPVFHESLGNGIIEKLEHSNLGPMLFVRFNKSKDLAKFLFFDFSKRFSIENYPVEIPDSEKYQIILSILKNNRQLLEAQEKIKQLEKKLREERVIEKYRQKFLEKSQAELEEPKRQDDISRQQDFYGIKNNHDPNTAKKLQLILKKRENTDVLSAEEIQWMLNRHYYDFVIEYFQFVYHTIKDPDYLIRAAKLCRRINRPEEALRLTDNLTTSNDQRQLSLLTIRGAAYKDLGDYEQAIALAENAQERHPKSYNAYLLLGMIYYSLMMYSKGDEFFQKAIELGASPQIYRNEIKAILTGNSVYVKTKLSNHLLSKDSQRYQWVTAHINDGL
jgi:tetratricopeptide (TPR) repeat protein